MKLPPKEEMSKVFALVGAIVAVFGCAAWRMVGASKPAPSASNDQPVAVQMKDETTPAAAVPATSNPDNAPIEVAAATSPVTGDPFKTLIPKNVGNVIQPPSLDGQVAPGKLTSIPGGPLSPDKLLPMALPKEPVVRLTGVLPGNNAVAVVEVDNNAYVLHQGEHFGDGYSLATIGTDRVAITKGGKRIRLLLAE